MGFRSIGVKAVLPWFLGTAAAFAQAGGEASSTTAPEAWGPSGAGAGQTGAGTSGPQAVVSRGVIVVALRGDELPREPLRGGLGEELSAPIVFESEVPPGDVRGVLTIHYARARQELAVTWDAAGRTVSRVITAPEDPADVVTDSVLLAGNLARSPVDELGRRVAATELLLASHCE